MTYIIDFETRSTAPIKYGPQYYARHPSTKVLCMAYAKADETGFAQLWVPGDSVPMHVIRGGVIAHNVGFESAIWEFVCAWGKPDWAKWNCTAARARATGLPGGLDDVSKLLLGPGDGGKDKRGAALIRQLCNPRPDGTFDDDPQAMAELFEYCQRDAEITRRIHKILPALSGDERAVWETDMAINRRGVPIDLRYVGMLYDRHTTAHAKLVQQYRAITDCNPTQTAKTLEWLRGQGHPLPNLQRETIRRALLHDMPENVRAVLNIRTEAARTSASKLTLIRQRAVNDRIHDVLTYRGANTGRWTSQGMQVHNFRGAWPESITPHEAFIRLRDGADNAPGDVCRWVSGLVRGVVRGRPFLASGDYRGIELRLAYHYSGDTDAVDSMVHGRDLYRAMAARVYSCPEDDVSGLQREVGKRIVLGLGYGLGAKQFTLYLRQYRVDYTPELCYPVLGGEKAANEKMQALQYRMSRNPAFEKWLAIPTAQMQMGYLYCAELVRNYRQLWGRAITDQWAALESAAHRITRYDPGAVINVMGGAFYREKNAIVYRRASGRDVRYWQPRFVNARDPITGRITDDLSLEIWTPRGKETLFGGKLFSHAIQGTARDVLADALVHLERRTDYAPVAHVHDEILSETADDDPVHYRDALLAGAKIHDWSSDLPLDASVAIGRRWLPKS